MRTPALEFLPTVEKAHRHALLKALGKFGIVVESWDLQQLRKLTLPPNVKISPHLYFEFEKTPSVPKFQTPLFNAEHFNLTTSGYPLESHLPTRAASRNPQENFRAILDLVDARAIHVDMLPRFGESDGPRIVILATHDSPPQACPEMVLEVVRNNFEDAKYNDVRAFTIASETYGKVAVSTLTDDQCASIISAINNNPPVLRDDLSPQE